MTDVIPTAPIYPDIGYTDAPDNFRLNKSNLILSYLEGQTKHYEKVRKKYARARSILHKISITAGTLSVVLSGSGLATSLTGPGVIVGIPLGAIGGFCGIISAVSAGVTKTLSKKISKHDTTIALSHAKTNTIADLVSKALRDQRIDDVEFGLILAEENKYEKLKSEIRNKKTIIKDLSEETRKKVYQDAMNDIQRKLAH